MEKLKINYSSSREIKDYLDSVAERYNMTVSGVITMIVMEHKFQHEALVKIDNIQDILEKVQSLSVSNNDTLS